MEQELEQQLSPVDKLRMRVRSRDEAVADFRARRKQLAAVKEAAAESPTFLGEAGKAVWGAGVDLVAEGGLFVADVVRSLPIVKNAVALYTAESNDTTYFEGFELVNQGWAEYKDAYRERKREIAPENETFAGSAARGILQFMVPYLGMSKKFGAAQTFAQATGRGFVIDAAMFDPTEGNLSKLIKELSPETQNVVLDFLATDPDDDDALNRLRNGLEGAFLGTALEAIFKMARFVKGKKQIEEAHAAADATSTPITGLFSARESELALADGPAPGAPRAEAVSAADEASPSSPPAGPQPEAGTSNADELLQPQRALEDDLRNSLKMTDAQRQQFNKMLLEGDDDGAREFLQKDFNLETVNWDNIESADDIKKLINVTSEVIADHIDNVKGGVQSHVQTKRLANLVGVSGEQVHELFKDVRGDKGIAARFHAAQRTLLASVKEVFRLRDVARANPGDLKAKADFFRQVELHAALQAEIKGAQTEVARALNGMAIIKNEAAEGFKEFDQLMRSLGGKGRSAKEFEKFMDDLLDGRSLEDLNAKIREYSRSERIKNMFVEYVINAMLSSPKTHVINFVSNSLNTFLYSADRLAGGAVRRLTAGDQAAWREAKIDLLRKVSSLDEAFKLARQAWKEGAPITDKRQRLEFQTRKAIAMDGDTWLAKTVNELGEVVRIPGRLLITGDEFFKTINRNAEMSVLAYREADRLATEQGMKYGTDEYERFVDKTMKALLDTENMTPLARQVRTGAIEKARMVSFQESPLTPGGTKMEALINHNAFVKLLIAPFFRTPMNILRQGIIDRTPLGLIIKDHREAVLRGNPRQQAEAIARMTSGVAAIAAFLPFVGTDVDSPIQVIGKVPYDSSEKATGVLDYSIRIGDKWYQFNRLDPLGMWLGMVADAKMHAEHSDDDEKTFALMQGALAGFLNNVVNKTWAKSLSDLFELFTGMAENKPSSVERAWERWAAQQTGKLIPQLVKSTGKAVFDGDEQVAREAWTFADALNAQLPIFNKGVPVRHDALGRPVTWENSKWAIVNPFAISPGADSPLEKELARLDFTVRPMPKTLGGGLIELTAEEYSQITGLVGSIKLSRHGNLAETLDAIVQSEDYAEWTDERRVFVMKKYIEAARRAARLTFLADPANRKRFKDARLDELSALFDSD